MGSLLNFRCPDDLWASIEKLGKDRHPGGEHHRSKRDYDLTATMLDIVRAGIAALENDPSLLDKTDHHTLNKTEVQAMIQAAIAINKTDHQTIDKTEIESMIQAAIAQIKPDIEALALEVVEGSEETEAIKNEWISKDDTEAKLETPKQENITPSSDWLNGQDLSQRLKVDSGMISRMSKDSDKFAEWTQEKDPDGTAWEKVFDANGNPVKQGKSVMYRPLNKKV